MNSDEITDEVFSFFRTYGYLGQIIISLVVKEVKHSPFLLGETDNIFFSVSEKKKIIHVFHFIRKPLKLLFCEFFMYSILRRFMSTYIPP
jgi:hypothetical protein